MISSLVISQSELDKLILAVKVNHGFDFSGYAMTSFSRRIYRFLEKNKLAGIDHLVTKLKSEDTFFEYFLNEVTVNTTDLFRDPGFWKRFKKKILPKLAKLDEINIWHAACSSGEEVVSMAICLKEAGLLDKTNFLATDINNEILDVAQSTKYHKWRLPQYEKNYKEFEGEKSLSDYYEIEDGKLNFDDSLTRNVKYKNFNLTLDTNFSKYDMILCRNVLIYFTKSQQEQVIEMLSNSIEGKGYLVLGAQESITWHRTADNFLAVSNDWKIYKKIR